MTIDITIHTGKGIMITDGTGDRFYIRNGNLKNFEADPNGQRYYFNPTKGVHQSYDHLLNYKDITTFNGVAPPDFTTLANAIFTELDAEF